MIDATNRRQYAVELSPLGIERAEIYLDLLARRIELPPNQGHFSFPLRMHRRGNEEKKELDGGGCKKSIMETVLTVNSFFLIHEMCFDIQYFV